jgi:hypothetical protein
MKSSFFLVNPMFMEEARMAVKNRKRYKPLPRLRTTISLDRTFTPQEMDRICEGVVARQMEDKWVIFWEGHSLFCHRSWTGFCVYVVRFLDDDGKWRMFEADVNRDPEQYKYTDDEWDAAMISYLIDVVLLRRLADFPPIESLSEEENVLMNWSLVGRAMLGEHPESTSDC